MEKIVIKRTYTMLDGEEYNHVCYIYSPLNQYGGESQINTIADAYRFEVGSFHLTQMYQQGLHEGEGGRGIGKYSYVQEFLPYKITAKEYAIYCHRETNHKYDKNKPYEVHLQMVVETAMKWIDLLPQEDRRDIIDACWCHDLIEDCRQTYNDVLKATNKNVAEIVYACTNEKGKNRAERGNSKYYEGIRNVKYASFVKLCDRIANATYSKENGSSQRGMYKAEHEHFTSHFALDGINDILIEHLNQLMGQ